MVWFVTVESDKGLEVISRGPDYMMESNLAGYRREVKMGG